LVLLKFFGLHRAFSFAAATCAALFLTVGLGVELDVHKMTAGVFRHGELDNSRDASILFAKDGKTATVHLVKYPDATSLRTNGKSDGSINMDPAGQRGSDEITMVLSAAMPLALRPETRTAAVIGIGTGLTTHTLLQSLDIERVETVEIEAAMAEASRGFMPRNSGAFADPRGAILIDDAKSFFSTRNRRYDLIISEPSNPWVSGVSGLFTREFYRRIRRHLNPDGMLVQWIQLYEIDASLVATVLGALGAEFPHYAVFGASDHDLLIMAAENPVPRQAQARIFEHPGVAKELWTVHVLSAGDLDARYLGSRETLEPLFASYAMPANSDYAPVLDLNAARHRFMEKSAADVVALLNAEVPLLELLEPQRSTRPVNPLFRGAYAFERVENTRVARYARDFLLRPRAPVAESLPRELQKDLELVKLRLIECRDPSELDVWTHSALRVARALNPYLAPDELAPVWNRITTSACYGALNAFQQGWLALFQATGARDPARMAELAVRLMALDKPLIADAREYLLLAAMAGYVASGDSASALELWTKYGEGARAARPAFRLLRCHAERSTCANAFSGYAER
ncbi:MAG TPA: hypothetical protein VFX94_01515, partial [Burkholderiales bacterium]|nr:hypothetical protein [Burkholderiales bacterium]